MHWFKLMPKPMSLVTVAVVVIAITASPANLAAGPTTLHSATMQHSLHNPGISAQQVLGQLRKPVGTASLRGLSTAPRNPLQNSFGEPDNNATKTQ